MESVTPFQVECEAIMREELGKLGRAILQRSVEPETGAIRLQVEGAPYVVSITAGAVDLEGRPRPVADGIVLHYGNTRYVAEQALAELFDASSERVRPGSEK